ncbi:hypothetical protein GOBAR_AA24498 [Gossypium barbadense]|uniref:Transcription factor CBF/NF-Y/archaeal histone domain-containing protein n=1 Tax=Gossypium barbadense TaxID=3634 RepID=A0A2P5WYM2_GOSBA|nr:hypothetical protein GOBAR_AA24498 [Gossypium barbadense]
MEARIKKIMQADEDVGKIALAVPVLVSKALELFLQDLCDHTYEITLQRGAKTMNSLHLKATGDEVNDSDEESKRSRMQNNKSHSTSGMVIDDGSELKEPVKENTAAEDANQAVRNFDLNAEVDENVDTKASATAAKVAAPAPPPSTAEPTTEAKHEEYPGWSLSDMDKIAIDPLQLARLGGRLDEDEEDYDEEGLLYVTMLSLILIFFNYTPIFSAYLKGKLISAEWSSEHELQLIQQQDRELEYIANQGHGHGHGLGCLIYPHKHNRTVLSIVVCSSIAKPATFSSSTLIAEPPPKVTAVVVVIGYKLRVNSAERLMKKRIEIAVEDENGEGLNE